MKAVGGYLGLELFPGKEYHSKAIRLNTGRNAFEYILRSRSYSKVYLPFFTCTAMLEPIKKLALQYEFYQVDESLKPVFDFSLIQAKEVLVYNNYFGLCDAQSAEVSEKCKNVVIDNSQAFFSKPIHNADTFYSPRKFFGVPDGAYLYTNRKLKKEIEQDMSYQRFEHLLGRIDVGAEPFYNFHKSNEATMAGQPIKTMSSLTKQLLKSIDYEGTAKKRRENFYFMHDALKDTNQLSFDPVPEFVPMVYPYLTNNGLELKEKLIANKVYAATYWPNVLDWTKPNMLEFTFTTDIVHLPIDQRYSTKELNIILELL